MRLVSESTFFCLFPIRNIGPLLFSLRSILLSLEGVSIESNLICFLAKKGIMALYDHYALALFYLHRGL